MTSCHVFCCCPRAWSDAFVFCGSFKSLEHEMPSGIRIFAVLMHAHLAGRAVRVRHFRNRDELQHLAQDDGFDFNFQEFQSLADERLVLPVGLLLHSYAWLKICMISVFLWCSRHTSGRNMEYSRGTSAWINIYVRHETSSPYFLCFMSIRAPLWSTKKCVPGCFLKTYDYSIKNYSFSRIWWYVLNCMSCSVQDPKVPKILRMLQLRCPCFSILPLRMCVERPNDSLTILSSAGRQFDHRVHV